LNRCQKWKINSSCMKSESSSDLSDISKVFEVDDIFIFWMDI
jgi:hypothetical protein